jgi:hypothetical protein
MRLAAVVDARKRVISSCWGAVRARLCVVNDSSTIARQVWVSRSHSDFG